MAYSKQTWVRGEKVASVKLNHMEDGIATISANGAIDTANLAPAAVTNDKLDQEAVDSNNIRTGAIITPLIYDGAVTIPKLGTDVIAELDNKADIDGSYESMTVGNAEQLVSSVGIEDQTPYNFRTSGGSVDIGDRMNLKAVIGGTVAWNQLVHGLTSSTEWGSETGVTASYADGVATVSSTAANNGIFDRVPFSAISGHKYLINFDVKGTADLVVRLSVSSSQITSGNFTISKANTWLNLTKVVSNTSTVTQRLYLLATTAYTDLQWRNVAIFDLTAMFGSAIADYVYTLESGTAGAGVAWLKKYGWFTKPYYPYAAALESVKTSAHKTVGFNQWDEEWEVGTINNTTGDPVTDNSRIRSKNYIPIIPNTTYYALDPTNRNNIQAYYYDANGNYLSYKSWFKGVFTTPQDAYYMRFIMGSSYGTTYKNDICINLSWDGERDGEYEPYEAHEYALDDITLRGILKLDANNNLYADGDRYLPDGTVERKYGTITFDGSNDESWYSASYNRAYIALPSVKAVQGGSLNFIASRYIIPSASTTAWSAVINDQGNLVIYLPDGTDVTAWKTLLSNNSMTVVYELAIPTTETASPYQQTQIIDDFGTEEFVDAAVEANERDVAIPVGNVTFYPQNLRKKIEGLPFDFSTLIARTEKAFKATKAYAVNEFLIINNQLYKVRTSIANGATITVGTNVIATTIGAELTAILNS